MTDKFKVGDRVRIIRRKYEGCEAIIESARYIHNWSTDNVPRYDILVDEHPSRHRTKGWAAKECWLAPIYDGYEKTTWEDCLQGHGVEAQRGGET